MQESFQLPASVFVSKDKYTEFLRGKTQDTMSSEFPILLKLFDFYSNYGPFAERDILRFFIGTLSEVFSDTQVSLSETEVFAEIPVGQFSSIVIKNEYSLTQSKRRIILEIVISAHKVEFHSHCLSSELKIQGELNLSNKEAAIKFKAALEEHVQMIKGIILNRTQHAALFGPLITLQNKSAYVFENSFVYEGNPYEATYLSTSEFERNIFLFAEAFLFEKEFCCKTRRIVQSFVDSCKMGG